MTHYEGCYAEHHECAIELVEALTIKLEGSIEAMETAARALDSAKAVIEILECDNDRLGADMEDWFFRVTRPGNS